MWLTEHVPQAEASVQVWSYNRVVIVDKPTVVAMELLIDTDVSLHRKSVRLVNVGKENVARFDLRNSIVIKD